MKNAHWQRNDFVAPFKGSLPTLWETPSASTLLYVRENLINYNLDIDISSLMLKNKSLEITTKLILQDKQL